MSNGWPAAPIKIWAWGKYKSYDDIYCSSTFVNDEEFDIPVVEYVKSSLINELLDALQIQVELYNARIELNRHSIFVMSKKYSDSDLRKQSDLSDEWQRLDDKAKIAREEVLARYRGEE